jgi:hypothetical protein
MIIAEYQPIVVTSLSGATVPAVQAAVSPVIDTGGQQFIDGERVVQQLGAARNEVVRTSLR